MRIGGGNAVSLGQENVTTMHNWSQNARRLDHANAELSGMRDPASAAAEYGGEFRKNVEGFIGLEVVLARVDESMHERELVRAAQPPPDWQDTLIEITRQMRLVCSRPRGSPW